MTAFDDSILLSRQIIRYVDRLEQESVDPEDRELMDQIARLVARYWEGLNRPDAIRLARALEEIPDLVRVAADEFYTRKAITSLPQMMDRFAKLQPLLANAVPDKRVNRYLREATRCFIYGFQQACVTLCRAAIETSLNDVFAARFTQAFGERIDLIDKIDQAARFKLIGPDDQAAAHSVRKLANEVLHAGPVSTDKAFECLANARGVLQAIYLK